MTRQTDHLDLIRTSCSQVLAGETLPTETARTLLDCRGADVVDLLAAANRVRVHFKGNAVDLCAVLNAKSGRCPEDCAFCAQSAHSSSHVSTYPLMSADEIFTAAQTAQDAGARSLGIVTSGLAPTDDELNVICHAVGRIRRRLTILPDASLGMLTPEKARKLKSAGLFGYHHNVETAESFFPEICSTHTYDDHLQTLHVAASTGFRICSGGIFGLGETLDQRIELADAMRHVRPDRVCMNFLMPVPGTRLASQPRIKPLDILKLIAVFRLMLPDRDINVCGGREMHLADLQGMIFFAGANVTMVGNYLTQAGRPASQDLRLLADLEITPTRSRDVDSPDAESYNASKD